MTCQQVAARLTDYLDGALTPAERARFEAHLEGCDDCRVFVAQFVRTLNALAELRVEDTDPGDLDALLCAFRELVG